ncbi:MAG: hypothetical protein HC829_02745 [Bacteroidales bacterium]|nr:hypothetical protein [Bacteroidales bacterium]
MRRVATGIEYGLLALGAAIVGFGVLIIVGDDGSRTKLASRSHQPTIIETAPDPTPVGSITGVGLRR